MTSPPAAILQLALRVDAGAEAEAVRQLTRALSARGWPVVVAGAGGCAAPAPADAGVRCVEVAFAAASPLALWRAAARIEALVRGEGIGLIHAHGETAALLAEWVARRTQRPWVASLDSATPPSARWLAALGVDRGGRADRVLVPSRDLAERLEAAGRVPADRLRLVPPAIDSSRFDPAAIDASRLARLATAWGVAPEQPCVLVPGPLAAHGGQLELLRALKRLARADLLAVFEGTDETDGAYRKQVELFARTAGLAGQMRLVDPPADRPAAFALASVVAFPATAAPAGFDRAVLEAQAMGTPVIAHALGALPEALMPASTGWLVDVGDTDGLAEALGLALAMPQDVRARTAARARAFVTTEFGAERAAAATVDVYGELLGAGPA
ncbi:MAG: glycosyltransferase [Alphaproteobacteria bacterium]